MRRLRARRTGVGAFSSVGGLDVTVDCICRHCGRPFRPDRRNAGGLYCSDACLQASHDGQRQQPGRWALVVWRTTGDMTARYSYFDTRAAAVAASPAGVPSTVVDRTITATRPHPSVEEVLKSLAAKSKAV